MKTTQTYLREGQIVHGIAHDVGDGGALLSLPRVLAALLVGAHGDFKVADLSVPGAVEGLFDRLHFGVHPVSRADLLLVGAAESDFLTVGVRLKLRKCCYPCVKFLCEPGAIIKARTISSSENKKCLGRVAVLNLITGDFTTRRSHHGRLVRTPW